jgi:hypothetical protein
MTGDVLAKLPTAQPLNRLRLDAAVNVTARVSREESLVAGIKGSPEFWNVSLKLAQIHVPRKRAIG